MLPWDAILNYSKESWKLVYYQNHAEPEHITHKHPTAYFGTEIILT